MNTPAIFEEHVPLAPLTTFGIGGPARWFSRATTETELAQACAWAAEQRLPLFVLGGGSNVLVADEGFTGLVLQVGLPGMQQTEGRFEVGAGESWDAFVTRACQARCGGVECLAGIPGTVGGTPVQNVGAYGQEVSSAIESVRCLDRQSLRFLELSRAECGFAYRSSRFNQGPDRDRYIVSRVTFRLQPNAPAYLEYADLRQCFTGRVGLPTLTETAAAVRAIRARKGMVIPPGDLLHRDPDTRSAGSFFKNPTVPQSHWEQLLAVFPDLPGWPAADDDCSRRKLSAAWLLEHAGFARGFALGQAALSSKHALALTNRSGHASAGAILALRDMLIAGVERRFGVRLEPEPVLVGNFPVSSPELA